jgi:hypothetical protein
VILPSGLERRSLGRLGWSRDGFYFLSNGFFLSFLFYYSPPQEEFQKGQSTRNARVQETDSKAQLQLADLLASC